MDKDICDKKHLCKTCLNNICFEIEFNWQHEGSFNTNEDTIRNSKCKYGIVPEIENVLYLGSVKITKCNLFQKKEKQDG